MTFAKRRSTRLEMANNEALTEDHNLSYGIGCFGFVDFESVVATCHYRERPRTRPDQRDIVCEDVVVTVKDLVGSNGVIHLVECVMHVQHSVDDDRLTAVQKSEFEQTACCLSDSRTDLHHQALLKRD